MTDQHTFLETRRYNTVTIFPIHASQHRGLKILLKDFIGGVKAFEDRRCFVIVEFHRSRDFARAMNLSGCLHLDRARLNIERFRGEEDAPLSMQWLVMRSTVDLVSTSLENNPVLNPGKSFETPYTSRHVSPSSPRITTLDDNNE